MMVAARADRDSADEPPVDVEVQVATDEVPLPAGADFERWVRAALSAAGSRTAGALAIRLVGTEEGRSLNESWRHKDGPTNVLAFPGPAGQPAAPVEFGDLVICLPVVVRESVEQDKEPRAHLAHLVVHGTLHLLGYTHDGEVDAARMEALETRVLTGLDFLDPYVTDEDPVPVDGPARTNQ